VPEERVEAKMNVEAEAYRIKVSAEMLEEVERLEDLWGDRFPFLKAQVFEPLKHRARRLAGLEDDPVATTYCAWCGTFLSGDPMVPYEAPGVSHGICRRCKENELTGLGADGRGGGA
jgi:hypothetical protein